MRSWPFVAVCGKFQPFHLEHLEYVLAAFSLGDHVVVGITNPDPSTVRPEPADPRRGLPESNPATYFERLRMVAECLGDAGVDRARYSIVPFPLQHPQLWDHYLPPAAVVLLTLFGDDPWLIERKARFERHGRTTHVMWERAGKTVTGSGVRDAVVRGEEWRSLVPAGTARVMDRHGIVGRIRDSTR
jgi:cytidyltransferase-like protein